MFEPEKLSIWNRIFKRYVTVFAGEHLENDGREFHVFYKVDRPTGKVVNISYLELFI